ncbi:MAG: signal recognition particle-docking protein FtsY [Deltaproteobacteria bacterium GWC2_42_51]|nr:MAG: signal recognition particle-docking protein FtsY [Bdellovibrionales bacterium RIFOXYB2_FULL_36_6]OGP11108.1 MAG: signal recognition particle-docking protein FtsY [Deltaproteobacteria bacterium GWA2_42_85]OGP31431.1 MAG: signal recognition particle-docking protein FtsY [Deltaproteobacteria bacterium GWC2_42_51]OGP43095.1 MAG: signal recognition particle-docking protein FtsY [Deltaproteobacteria bacterium GWD2_42_10]OGP47783.1 MAG: signal recognition particle-docking protein FtsY [Deltapr
MKNLYERLKSGLAKTHNNIVNKIDGFFSSGASRQELEEMLEETLITADVGVKTSGIIVEGVANRFKGYNIDELKGYLRDAVFEILRDCQRPLEVTAKPFVIMVLGVNGVGKTTTIGKLASRLTFEGKKVILAAGDTFRAAAIEQLEVWGKRTSSDVIKQSHGGDPAAVAFDAIKAAVARDVDVVILDTAGRLHTKINLMEELKKVKRVVSREIAGAPHEVLLVLDASTGQNAINQAKIFNEAIGVTGIALTKLDGTAKGGIIVAIANELKIPIRFIGVGEGVEDLRQFDAKEFVEAMI